MPCPHFDVKIIQRSKRQSAVASAAYQSGERLFSEYDQKQKYYSHKSEIVHTEIMLPPHAPPEYADRNTLWNAAEAISPELRACAVCGKAFLPEGRQAYCSDACKAEGNRRKSRERMRKMREKRPGGCYDLPPPKA